ncbi:BgTH12-00934 [Blumeria graminis f. sp. triticale]|uniref:Bgt-2751 n=3 Tax=Blumeria graminis TaxID=34373 RepID=A0A381L5Y5_BLUGR|nr:hypothetical protein BGT96224_2751 [Blumeria graminis f. sp. tritici 96224]CAD6505443.1 BgTH12-00934 [Blumeria graminis f. sp. triticale]VDB93581.1 Bgt-2751 [Blumeria graminis f. sp. tritici]
MAQKARKDRARNNVNSLNKLHIGTLLLNSIFLLSNYFLSKRSLLAYFLLSIPSFVSEYILETTGRPKFDTKTKAIRSSGEDLSASGLTEYMFDTVWLTWSSLISVMIFGNWGWLILAAVPIYGAYKGYTLLGMARGMLGPQTSDNSATKPKRNQ